MTEPDSSLLTRVGIIGDVHSEDDALARALDFLRTEGIPKILCTGDIVSGPGDANRCCHLLELYGVSTVRGNHDRWFFGPDYADKLNDATPPDSLDITARAFLETLPPTRSFATPRGPLLLSHGTDTNDMLGVYPNDGDWVLEANWKLQRLYAENNYRYLVGGHTHARMVRTFDHLTLINPGTLKRDQQPGFLVIDFPAGLVTVFDLTGDTILPQQENRLHP